MHIVIVGSGLAGLATYQFLRKLLPDSSSHTIKIYEGYPKSSRGLGGGISLSSNGIRVLHALSPEIVSEKLLAPSASFKHGTLTVRDSRGQILANMAHGREERYGFPSIMIARDTIYTSLEDGMPEGAVTYRKRVASVKELDSGKVQIEFENGTLELADLDFGADGVRSAVRPAVVGVGYEAKYRGLTGIGGYVPVDTLPESFKAELRTNPMMMTFGRDGFFAYGPICSLDEPSPRIIWWSTFAAATPLPRDLPRAEVREKLLARHGDWVSPISKIIELGTADDTDLLVLPVYITPHIPRFSTTSGRIILLGDAAHAMPPDSAQGGSLALEDSQTVSMLLSHYLVEKKDEAEALRCTAEGFETLRKGRAERVLKDALRRGENKKALTWWQEYIRNWSIWFFSWLPESLQDWRFGYDVAVEVDGLFKRETEQKKAN